MAGIIGVSDAIRDRTGALVEAAVSTFRDAVRPIFGSSDKGRPVHIGSCIAIRVDGKCYLLTAAHIVDQNEHTTLYVGGNHLHPLSAEFLATVKPSGTRKLDRYDFALGKLSDDDLVALSGVKFVEKTDILWGDGKLNGHVFTSIGYPNSKNKKVDDSSKSVLTQLYHYSNVAKSHPTLAKELKVSGEDHLFIKFNDKRSQNEAGAFVYPPSLRGMSGGAVISLGDISDPDVVAGCRDPRPMLAALFIEFYKAHKIIVATRMSCVLDAIRVGPTA